jgi:hypothetical protein
MDEEALAALAKCGLVLLKGVADPASLLRLARSIAMVVSHRDSDQNGVTTIADLGEEHARAGFGGFTDRALSPHTDGSAVTRPPSLLITSCRQPAPAGGECVLVDGRAIHEDLADSAPEALAALRQPRAALFGGIAGYRGPVFTDQPDGRVAIRLRLDDLVQFSPEASRSLPVLRAAIDRHAITVSLAAGEGYVLNNHRWLHGRRAFVGARVLNRILAYPLPGLGLRAGWTGVGQNVA